VAISRPYLCVGETLTVGLAARVLDVYRDDIAYELAYLAVYLDRCDAGIVDGAVNTVEQLAAWQGRRPRAGAVQSFAVGLAGG
jgi:hypothetical protein